MKYRISKATLSKLPAEVAQAIKDIQARYSDHSGTPYFKSFTFRTMNAGQSYYHSEGSSITYIYGDNQITGEIQSENNYSGVSIGYGPKLPPGTIVIDVSYYAGYYMTVTSIGEIGLGDGK